MALLSLLIRAYQGIYNVYANGLLPLKTKRYCKLDGELKIYNQEFKKIIIRIEHVFSPLKIFKTF